MRKSILGVLAALGIAATAFGQSVNDARVAHQQAIIDAALSHAEVQTSCMESKVRAFGFAQFRWLYDSESPTGSRMGFDVRKGVIGVEGEVADNWNFVLSGQWTPDTSLELRDAYVNTKFDNIGFTAGRFRMPFMIEWQTDEPNLLGNDYSLIAYTFGQGRSEGVQFSYEFSENFEALFSYNNGFEQENTTIFNTNTWGMSGRLQYSGIENLQLGGAIAYNNTDSYHNFNWTVDGTLNFTSSLFATGSYTSRSDDVNGDGWGSLIQLGYLYSDSTTLFAQYEFGEFDGSNDFLSVASLGVTYMFAPNVRWTNQAGYSFNAIDSNWNVDQTGWSNTSSDGQFLFTTQMTVSF